MVVNERQLRGLQANLQGAINLSEDGAYAQLDLATANKIVEALKALRAQRAAMELSPRGCEQVAGFMQTLPFQTKLELMRAAFDEGELDVLAYRRRRYAGRERRDAQDDAL